MSKIIILCIENNPETLEALVRDLAPLKEFFPVIEAGSIEEAQQQINAIKKRGHNIGVIFCEQNLDGEDSIHFLIELKNRDFTKDSRKVMVTADTGTEAAIRAMNEANLSHCLTRPWDPDKLIEVTKTLVTRYILRKQLDPKPYLQVMDPLLMADAIRHGLMGDQ